MNPNDPKISLEEAWIHYDRAHLQRRYGVGTFIAVYEGVVVDWDADADALRERAEKSIGDTVFVGPVPDEPPFEDGAWDREASRHLEDLKKANPHRRRLMLNVKRHYEIGELIGSRGCELLGGVVYIEGLERRYAEHDHRLLVEHDLVPKETILVGGIIFWKDAPADVPDTAWIHNKDAENDD
jgi:hypothetical protein